MEKYIWEQDGYILRLAYENDAEEYYSNNFNPLDPEIARLTGSKSRFTHDEVVDFFRRCIAADDRFDFIVIDPDDHIIGESVINEIDPATRCANFRIAMFHSDKCGKGIGAWVIEKNSVICF